MSKVKAKKVNVKKVKKIVKKKLTIPVAPLVETKYAELAPIAALRREEYARGNADGYESGQRSGLWIGVIVTLGSLVTIGLIVACLAM